MSILEARFPTDSSSNLDDLDNLGFMYASVSWAETDQPRVFQPPIPGKLGEEKLLPANNYEIAQPLFALKPEECDQTLQYISDGRRALSEHLQDEGFDELGIEKITLTFMELAVNALIHGGGVRAITIARSEYCRGLLVTVSDCTNAETQRPANESIEVPDDPLLHGYGLNLVDEYSLDKGYQNDEFDAAGRPISKTVWREIDITSSAA